MTATKPLSVREALGRWQRTRRPRASEDPRVAQAAREDFRALGWVLEYTQRHQSLLWLGHGVDGFGSRPAEIEFSSWCYYEGWDDW